MSIWTGTAHSVFLPLRFTPLDSGPSRSIRRHFVEISMWAPGRDRDSRMLKWMLCEIVRDAVVGITTEQLATAIGPRPPRAAVDINRLARVRVTDSGDVEWLLVNATPPRRRIIAPPIAREQD